jgi:6-phosphogluconolactonase
MASAQLAAFSAREIAAVLRQTVANEGHASLGLAGGNTPRASYLSLAELPDVPWDKVTIYFGDERCVPADHPDSNYRMADEALLSRVKVAAVERMDGPNPDREAAARAYEAVLPAALDVLLLGIGEDGHTASLFPGSVAARELTRMVVPVVGPKPPPERLSVTPRVLQAARYVIMLAAGAGKATTRVARSSLRRRALRSARCLADRSVPSGVCRRGRR